MQILKKKKKNTKNMIFRAKKHIYLFPTPASKTIPPSRDIKNPSIFKITNFNFSKHYDAKFLHIKLLLFFKIL